MEFHEVCKMFPKMENEEFSGLVTDIKDKGLIEPIYTYQRKIIDGRNRYLACLKARVKPRFEKWNKKGSLIGFVTSLNLQRRHLTESQRAVIALVVLPEFEKEAKKRELAGKPLDPTTQMSEGKGESAHLVGKIFKVSGTYIKDAKKIKQENPKLIKEIAKGNKTITQANREIKEEKREQRRKENTKRAKRTKPMKTKAKFATIVIDPPWDWKDEGDQNQLGRAKPDYNTMSLEEIRKLPIEKLADKDCHAYLWITNRSLPKGFKLLEDWGFRYITCLTWCKPSIGMGNYFRGSTEHILFGVKGSQPLKRKDVGTWFTAKRGKQHSEKPEDFYKLVKSCSPGPYLDMFARIKRKDWFVWGAEI